MNQTINNQTINNQIETMAFKSIYELQYNSGKAARFVCEQVPTASFEAAVAIINRIVRPTTKIKGK